MRGDACRFASTYSAACWLYCSSPVTISWYPVVVSNAANSREEKLASSPAPSVPFNKRIAAQSLKDDCTMEQNSSPHPNASRSLVLPSTTRVCTVPPGASSPSRSPPTKKEGRARPKDLRRRCAALLWRIDVDEPLQGQWPPEKNSRSLYLMCWPA